MSTLKVECVKVNNIIPHPNADRLEIAVIKGWNCVVRKGDWHVGDLGVYFPIDSVLDPEVEAAIFPPESKIKLSNSRVRTIKLRGAISQGLLVAFSDVVHLIPRELRCNHPYFRYEGADLTSATKTIKFEPPDNLPSQDRKGKTVKHTKSPNPYFHKYTDIENFKNYVDLFKDTDFVVILEKIHGTNFRAGWVPFHATTWWEKCLEFVGFTPTWVFVYGSHNVQLQNRFMYGGYYKKNVYSEAVERYDLQKRIPKGFVIYGEIYGVGIQKGYKYGLEEGPNSVPRELRVFDVKAVSTEKYLDHRDATVFIQSMGLKLPPEIYIGIYPGQQLLKKWVDGPSLVSPSQEIREGIVVKAIAETTCYLGRKILKYKSDEFLARFEDDTH